MLFGDQTFGETSLEKEDYHRLQTLFFHLDMLFPVRCWTCGRVIGHLWEAFNEAINQLQLSGSEMDSLE